MKISIVTPSFNQDQFLPRTIESVINQTGDFEIELIVMDGGSKDNSVKILQQYEEKLKNQSRVKFIWKSKKDNGQSDAINQGLKTTTGDIVAYLNSDDTYTSDAFEKVVSQFEKQPDALWLSSYCHIIDEQDKIIQPFVTKYKNWWLRRYSYSKLLTLNFICQPATFWRREVLEKIGLFNEDYHYTMDYDYWLRLGKISAPIIVQDYLANFRIHQTSKGKQAYLKQFEQDFQVACRYTQNYFIIAIHWLHNKLIELAYRILK